jgi:CHASE2 domain-containing sensor protein
MAIDYIGPTGAFAAATYSISDIIDGKAAAARLADKYVLIGATAVSLGDRFSSPFLHDGNRQNNPDGTFMPGVEVLANALNSVLRSRFYSQAPVPVAIAWTVALAALTLGLLAAAQGRHAFLKHVGVLAGVAALAIFTAHLAFSRWLTVLPLTAGMVSFASSGVLGLLRRSLVTSSRLDASIARMARAKELLVPATTAQEAAGRIAELLNASAAAIFAARGRERYRLAGA